MRGWTPRRLSAGSSLPVLVGQLTDRLAAVLSRIPRAPLKPRSRKGAVCKMRIRKTSGGCPERRRTLSSGPPAVSALLRSVRGANQVREEQEEPP
jgi:hypothetical protein